MQQSVPDYLELLRALRSENVGFVVVGGLALVLHGSSYVTNDLDISVSVEQTDSARSRESASPLRAVSPAVFRA
ncbi:MAG TPA: hypothetical protein VK934_02760 [Fimbriimonas sp.]|nr:hypothetical protein [Fimbriimonas sp.]